MCAVIFFLYPFFYFQSFFLARRHFAYGKKIIMSFNILNFWWGFRVWIFFSFFEYSRKKVYMQRNCFSSEIIFLYAYNNSITFWIVQGVVNEFNVGTPDEAWNFPWLNKSTITWCICVGASKKNQLLSTTYEKKNCSEYVSYSESQKA